MAKKKFQNQMGDQGKKQQDHLSTRLQGLFKKAKGKQNQNNKNRVKSQCPEIIDVESYTSAVEDPNPLEIPVLERESVTQKNLERESGDTVTSSLEHNIVSINFGCDYYYPVQEFLGDCFGYVFEGDYLAMKEGIGSYVMCQEAEVGDVGYSTDDMLEEFLKENIF